MFELPRDGGCDLGAEALGSGASRQQHLGAPGLQLRRPVTSRAEKPSREPRQRRTGDSRGGLAYCAVSDSKRSSDLIEAEEVADALLREPLDDWSPFRIIGIEQGIVDVLGSDHAPHTLEEKAKVYPASPSGMTGVQTLVPLMLDHVNAGRLSLARFVDLSSAGPARLFNIACKGRIAAGYDADFTVVDLKRRETITNKWVASRAGWTPYDGVEVTGWPVGTFVRGRRVMWQGELMGPSTGEPVRFLETLKA